MQTYNATIGQSTFVYNETSGLYECTIDMSQITGFEDKAYNITMIKVMRYISETGAFKEVLIGCQVSSDSKLTIYAHERFNFKILVVTDN